MEHRIKRRQAADVRTADGFSIAVKQAERLLFAVSYAILGNGDACADAVQAALLKAWERRDSLKDPALFQSWLVRIVENECKNQFRRRPSIPLDENLPGPEAGPDRLDVQNAFLHLPEKARLVAALYYFERYSVSDISKLLHLPQGTVHSRLSRAREQLRKELPDYEKE